MAQALYNQGMEEKNYAGLVPGQSEGRAITAVEKKTCENETDAKALYANARQRLLFVHQWGKIAGALSADFQLTDNNGREVDRPAKPGDHFRIDITGPGSKAGEGYDWAKVEEIREVHPGDVDSIAILVRPAANPQTPNPNIAHFFSEGSTSTFTITREGTTVTAAIYDRNIEANEETKETLDKLRNAVVGLGAKHGFSKLQWQALVKAFLETE